MLVLSEALWAHGELGPGASSGTLDLPKRAHPFSQLSPSLAPQAGQGGCCPQEPPAAPRSPRPTPAQGRCSWPLYNLPELGALEFVSQR